MIRGWFAADPRNLVKIIGKAVFSLCGGCFRWGSVTGLALAANSHGLHMRRGFRRLEAHELANPAQVPFGAIAMTFFSLGLEPTEAKTIFRLF